MKSKRPQAPTAMTDTTGMTPHKDHFHDAAGNKHYGSAGGPAAAPSEKDVAAESIAHQKAGRRKSRRGTSVLSTMFQSRGGSGSAASRSGRLG